MDYDAKMDDRVTRVEKDVESIRVDIAGIHARLDNCATKADLALLETRMVKWFVATWLAMAGMLITSVGVKVGIIKYL